MKEGFKEDLLNSEITNISHLIHILSFKPMPAYSLIKSHPIPPFSNLQKLIIIQNSTSPYISLTQCLI